MYNKLLEMNSKGGPYGLTEYKILELERVAVPDDCYCDADCNGISPTHTRLVDTEM